MDWVLMYVPNRGRTILREGTIKKALKNFGLTEKEGEIYLFLAKMGPKKTGQIANSLKQNKGLIYRILKSLQEKGLVEATLESPVRYTPVPFEKVIDSHIKAKREEALLIEKSKKDLLSEWNRISQAELDSSIEKFSIIEGRKKVFQKITQMIKQANKRFSIALTVSELLRAEQLGVFDSIRKKGLNSKTQFQFLTQISKENLKFIKILENKLSPISKFRGINPNLGTSNFSRIIIRDKEEMVLFLTEKNKEYFEPGNQVCLCTNCKSLINALSNTFNDLWRDSILVKKAINQIETGKPIPQMLLIKDSKIAEEKFEEILEKLQNELLIVTSSTGLVNWKDWLDKLRKTKNERFSVKIMTPIIEKNLDISKKLLEYYEVKHIPSTYIETVIFDGLHLFQFKQQNSVHKESEPFFRNTLYTNDIDYIIKTRNMFNDLWNKSSIPSSDFTIKSIFTPNEKAFEVESSGFTPMKNFRKVLTFSIEDQDAPQKLTEKDVLNKILRTNKEKRPVHHPEAKKMFASTGQAIIHPPDFLNLPSLMFHAFHIDEQSHLGRRDSLVIFLWLDTPNGFGFVPFAHICTKNFEARGVPSIFKDTPAERNFIHLNENEFYVRVHGSTLYAGWTKSIPLLPTKYTLPPCCLSLEGIGPIKTGQLSLLYKSGFKTWIEFNAFEALVTFFHPSSQYSGPGTDGILFRDYVGESFFPKSP